MQLYMCCSKCATFFKEFLCQLFSFPSWTWSTVRIMYITAFTRFSNGWFPKCAEKTLQSISCSFLLCHFHSWAKFYIMHQAPASSGNCIYTDNSGENRSMTNPIPWASTVDSFRQVIYIGWNNSNHYLCVYFHSLKTKPPNLIIPLSVVVPLEASFWPRFSQWDILGKMIKTVAFTLCPISLSNIPIPTFSLPLNHSCILSQESEVTGLSVSSYH